MRSFLAKFQPTSAMSDDELYRKKRDAWIDEKILVLTPEQMAKLCNKEHATVIEIGNRLYKGKK